MEKEKMHEILRQSNIRDLENEVAHMRGTYPNAMAKLEQTTQLHFMTALLNYKPEVQEKDLDIAPSVFSATLNDQPQLLEVTKNIQLNLQEVHPLPECQVSSQGKT